MQVPAPPSFWPVNLITFQSNTITLPRKPKLLAELEVSSLAAHNPEDDFEAALDDKMQKMIPVREKMFADAGSNTEATQARYKKYYDKKRSQVEVIDRYNMNAPSLTPSYRKCVLVPWSSSETASVMQTKWLGPYVMVSSTGKGLYRIKNPCSENVLKDAVHSV